MPSDIQHWDPHARTHTYASSPRKAQGMRAPDDDGPRVTNSEPGQYAFSADLGGWVPVRPFIPSTVPPGPSTRPLQDGSGMWWRVICDGQVMWLIEAASFESAKLEKDRLCLASGARPGWAYVRAGR